MKNRMLIQWICIFGSLCLSVSNAVGADLVDTIGKVKSSILVVGYYKSTNSPRFSMRGSGFVNRFRLRSGWTAPHRKWIRRRFPRWRL